MHTAFDGRTVVLTGCTGFLGKVILERLLWDFPNVSSVRCLVRGATADIAQGRLDALWPLELFDRLRESHGGTQEGFRAWVDGKVACCAGDIEQEGFGMDEAGRRAMSVDVDIVIHCAALVSWDERLDRSLNANCLGSRRLMQLIGSLGRQVRFLYVSSTFTNGMRCERRETAGAGDSPRKGMCLERAFDPDRSIMQEEKGDANAPDFSLEAEIDAIHAFAAEAEQQVRSLLLSCRFPKKFPQKAKEPLPLPFSDVAEYSRL